MQTTYHYHALWQTQPGLLSYADGIYHAPERIDSLESYTAFREVIATELGVAPAALTICSLTLLASGDIPQPAATELRRSLAEMSGLVQALRGVRTLADSQAEILIRATTILNASQP